MSSLIISLRDVRILDHGDDDGTVQIELKGVKPFMLNGINIEDISSMDPDTGDRIPLTDEQQMDMERALHNFITLQNAKILAKRIVI